MVADREVEAAEAGDAVTLTLADEIDIARGDVLSSPETRPEVADQFAAHLLWMSAEPMLPGRSYLLKIGGRTTPASVTELKHRLDVNNFDKLAAKHSISTKSASATSRPPWPWPSTPMPTIATPAASS